MCSAPRQQTHQSGCSCRAVIVSARHVVRGRSRIPLAAADAVRREIQLSWRFQPCEQRIPTCYAARGPLVTPLRAAPRTVNKMLRAAVRLNVSTGLVASAAAAGQYTTRCDVVEKPQRRVTPVRELERDVIVLERQVAGEPLKRINLEEMIQDLADPSRKLVMFGEHHDDAKAQDVERSVYDGMARRQRDSRRRVALALEFVDADARRDAESFASGRSNDVAKLFRGDGDAKRYGPLAFLARALGGPIVAANAPRRHARLVAKQGVGALDTISGDDVAKLPPLPYHHTPLSKAYAERLQMVGLRSKNVVAAQCLWDAAMAHSCLDFLKTNTRDAIMLVCGAFHVQHFLGVVDHVEKYTESGGPFEPLDRDEFRVVVCVPMDGPSFLRRSLVDVWDDPSLDTVADFIVFTRGGHGGVTGVCAA